MQMEDTLRSQWIRKDQNTKEFVCPWIEATNKMRMANCYPYFKFTIRITLEIKAKLVE